MANKTTSMEVRPPPSSVTIVPSTSNTEGVFAAWGPPASSVPSASNAERVSAAWGPPAPTINAGKLSAAWGLPALVVRDRHDEDLVRRYGDLALLYKTRYSPPSAAEIAMYIEAREKEDRDRAASEAIKAFRLVHGITYDKAAKGGTRRSRKGTRKTRRHRRSKK